MAVRNKNTEAQANFPGSYIKKECMPKQNGFVEERDPVFALFWSIASRPNAQDQVQYVFLSMKNKRNTQACPFCSIQGLYANRPHSRRKSAKMKMDCRQPPSGDVWVGVWVPSHFASLTLYVALPSSLSRDIDVQMWGMEKGIFSVPSLLA